MALEKEYFKFRQYSFAISLLSPLEKGCDTSFRGSGNTLPDLPSVVKIGSVVIENEYYQFFQCISALLLLFLFEKRMTLLLIERESLYPL